jgi:hypothetical protein
VDWQSVLLAGVGVVGELVKRLVLCLPCALCGPNPSKARDLLWVCRCRRLCEYSYQEQRMEWLAAVCHAKEEERSGARHGREAGRNKGKASKGGTGGC